MIRYRIKDLQEAGFFEGYLFETTEEVRQALINLHSIDWTIESDINTWALNDLLEYGSWEIVKCLVADNTGEILKER